MLRQLLEAILRNLPGHRALVEQARSSAERMLVMQGEKIQSDERIRSLEEQLTIALDNERKTYQMIANVHIQNQYGFTPFPAAPSIPDQVSRQIVRSGGVSEFRRARDIVRSQSEAALNGMFPELFDAQGPN